MTIAVVVLACLLSFGAGGLVFARWSRGRFPIFRRRSSESDAPPDASLRDEVTALYNRKHLLNRLEECMARCDREGKKMAVILWDLDDFAGFNNTFGRREGDKLLKSVADVIRRSIRIYDGAFRSGADEFCALLMPVEEEVAIKVKDRVVQTIERFLFRHEKLETTHRIRVTSGLVFYPAEHKLPDALLYAAGQALYRGRLTRESHEAPEPN